MRRKTNHAQTAVLAAFTAATALIFVLELASFERTHANSIGLSETELDKPQIGLSQQAAQDVLHWCHQQLSPPASLVKTSAGLSALARQCFAVSQKVLAPMPSHSHGLFVAAIAEHHLGNRQSSRDLFIKSVSLAPNEGWLAQRRVAFAFQSGGALLADQSDIGVLLTTQSGAELLTGYYVRHPETRTEITQLVSAASAPDQHRFVNLLRIRKAAL